MATAYHPVAPQSWNPSRVANDPCRAFSSVAALARARHETAFATEVEAFVAAQHQAVSQAPVAGHLDSRVEAHQRVLVEVPSAYSNKDGMHLWVRYRSAPSHKWLRIIHADQLAAFVEPGRRIFIAQA